MRTVILALVVGLCGSTMFVNADEKPKKEQTETKQLSDNIYRKMSKEEFWAILDSLYQAYGLGKPSHGATYDSIVVTPELLNMYKTFMECARQYKESGCSKDTLLEYKIKD